MAEHVILVENKAHWKPSFPAYPVITAKEYLTDPDWSGRRGLRVINLCRTHRYLGEGYYCSLLAEARGHKVIPATRTIQDLRRRSLYSLETPDINQSLQEILNRGQAIETTAFEVIVIFGNCAFKELKPLVRELFELFRTPIFKVEFRRDNAWRMNSIKPVAIQQLTPEQEATFLSALEHYMSKRWSKPRPRPSQRYDLAILHDPTEEFPPSDEAALQKFLKAAKDLDLNAELVTRRDFSRLAEFDALFIRETTGMDHHTYRFARKAFREGMVVIDDPDSILRCTNKIYLSELLRTHRIPAPREMIIQAGMLDELERTIPYPIVLKIPDGSFSRGISKVENRNELEETTRTLFKQSELLLAQAYTYTEFDWRVGVLNRQPLVVCQYFMAADHWQIYNHGTEETTDGTWRTMSVEEAPKIVVETALKAANLIGDGFYGVDLKQTGDVVLVIEVNDNPSVESDVEDQVLGEALYQTVMKDFLRRLELKRTGTPT
ncbi:MAG: glutathione synthase/RimK-type ligase-like ATP-grasp enzyme [Verrucomicrobiales bacterium]|jgi:glutathione synthase/RimK-type ligase-like ATP-grasp enzyme